MVAAQQQKKQRNQKNKPQEQKSSSINGGGSSDSITQRQRQQDAKKKKKKVGKSKMKNTGSTINDDDDAVLNELDQQKHFNRRKKFYVIIGVLTILVAIISIILAVTLDRGGNKTKSSSSSLGSTTSNGTVADTSGSGSSNVDGGLPQYDVTSTIDSSTGKQRQHIIMNVGEFHETLQVYEHDPNYFTQGLLYYDSAKSDSGCMIEGTGNYGESELVTYKIDDNTNDGTTTSTTNDPLSVTDVIQHYALESEYFGEGISLYYKNDLDNDGATSTRTTRLIQITWKRQVAFVYDVIEGDDSSSNNISLKPIFKFKYTTTTTEGWGITFNPTSNVFYVTDGSSYVHIWDVNVLWDIEKELLGTSPQQQDTSTTSNTVLPMYTTIPSNLEVSKFRVSMVSERSPSQSEGTTSYSRPTPIDQLNEIEYDPYMNTLLSNVWYNNVLLRIKLPESNDGNPDDDELVGNVITMYNFQTLYTDRSFKADSFNGISLTPLKDQTPNELYVTGKYWPYLYRIKLLQ